MLAQGAVVARTIDCAADPAFECAGTRRADVISGSAGNDLIEAKGGPDRVRAGAGNDSVYGGPGADRPNVVDGDAFDLVCTGGQAGDRVRADAGDEIDPTDGRCRRR